MEIISSGRIYALRWEYTRLLLKVMYLFFSDIPNKYKLFNSLVIISNEYIYV